MMMAWLRQSNGWGRSLNNCSTIERIQSRIDSDDSDDKSEMEEINDMEDDDGMIKTE